jgi:hypothetical protein
VRSADCGTRNGELEKWLYLLVIVGVSTLQDGRGCAGSEGGVPMQKKGASGRYKKRIFHHREKGSLFAGFERRKKTFVWMNKDGRLVKVTFLVVGAKPAKKGFKINIASNLP